MDNIIRFESAADSDAIRNVHDNAFGGVGESTIVDALRSDGYARVSLVAEAGGAVVGHILFSDLPILTDTGTVAALALAPLAVLPEFQRQGIGSALARAGLEACRERGYRIVVVLGHPHFYTRFGFSAELARPLLSPFGGREEWMAVELMSGALNSVSGWVRYPPPFGIGIQVRPVYRPDRVEWARMRHALWPDVAEDQLLKEVDASFAPESNRGQGVFPAEQAFVAEEPTESLCGFVEVSVRPQVDGCSTPHVGYIEGWYVDPDFRGRGVGRRLIEAAECWAIAQGCRELASDTQLGNAPSQDAHRALGFEETDRLVHFRKGLSDSHREVETRRLASHELRLIELPGLFAVCRMPGESPLPPWATAGNFFSVTRTGDELSIVCRQEVVPAGVTQEPNYRCLRVDGVLPHSLVGVLASLTAPLAHAGVSVFAFSTFDTDYLLVQARDFPRAVVAWRAAGVAVSAMDR